MTIAVGSAFAQTASEVAFKQRVADAAAKYKDGKASEAMTDFMKLYGENPKNADVNSWIGFLHLRNKEADEAIPFLETAKSLSPKDLEVLNNLGNSYLMAGQKQKALSTYQELIAMDDTRFQAFYNIGNIQLDDHRYSQAETSFSRALNLRKNSAQVYNNLGVAQEGQNKLDKAESSFMKASDLDAKDMTYARNAGAVAYKSHDYANAIKYIERSMKNGNNDKTIILALGDSYEKTGRKADLTRLYDANQDAFAGDVNYYVNLGLLKKDGKDSDGAEEAFRKALSLDSENKEALSNLGVLLFNKGEYTESRAMFDKLVSIDPSYRNKKNLAAAASRDGDYRAAMPIWSDLLKADSNDNEVRLLLADALYDTDDTKAAMGMYKQITYTMPNSAAALDGIGRCHLRDANYAAAEVALKSAIKADKSYVPAYNNLAVVLEKMNKRAEAIKLLETAASMDANNADVQKNLKRMRAAG
ncbi:MAG: tetratricopeptide repeat protein [Armatimonadetes bacterium]|nr:tetratricopeptide repeat protein [Armatimonadota bacterium]MBS1725855.1 tetratricopeptide repeat protein [Armatimonadota bacterium]